MKFALMLYGQPRFIKESFEFGWKKIIDKYNCDVYIHAWFDDTWINKTLPHYVLHKSVSDSITYETLTDIIRLYKPKSFIYEPPPIFEKIMHPYTNVDQRIEQAIYGQHISAFKANKMRIDSGIEYDFVMKSRMDVVVDIQNIEQLPKDKISVPYLFNVDMMSPIMDQYALGNPEQITQYCDIALHINRYIEMGATVQSEFLLHLNMIEQKIPIHRIPYTGVVTREYIEHLKNKNSTGVKNTKHIDHYDITGNSTRQLQELYG